MFKKIFAITTLAALAVMASATKTLVINRVLINAPKIAGNGADDPQGLEMFEIKNTGTASVDLTGVALVIIENEAGQLGELDGYYKFASGTSLAAGQTLTIRDGTASGSTGTYTAGPAITAPNATSNGSTTGYEFFSAVSGQNATDLSNSGAAYILVDDFNETRGSYSFLTQLDANNDGVLDFKATTTTTDDLWTISLDAVVVFPDGVDYPGGRDDYSSGLGLTADHHVVGTATPSNDWTPDYLMRMYYTDGSGVDHYDKFIQADLNAPSGTSMTFDTAQFRWNNASIGFSDIQNASNTAFSTTVFPTFYVAVHQKGNFTSWTGANSFDHVRFGTLNYKH